MKILVINSGSSSIKFQLFEMPAQTVLASGMVERIGEDNSVFKLETTDKEIKIEFAIANHQIGLEYMVNELMVHKVIGRVDEIDRVGHRVVHGGEKFSAPILINEEIKTTIDELSSLAPLHNPANLTGIEVAESVFLSAKQVAVFDTAFHQTMPEKAFRIAIPKELYTKEGIRVYGFHGTSHHYVSQEALSYLKLNNKESKIVVLHLGNGASISAIKDGKCIDTSMGLTPLAGVAMGTRAGTIDPFIPLYLQQRLKMTSKEVDQLLNKESGMKGLTGTSDMRDVESLVEQGNEDAKLALALYAYRIQKYIGMYVAALNGLDALVFTAGIGENSILIREMICDNMNYLGIELDEKKNNTRKSGILTLEKENSRVNILRIPTNEELAIAKSTFEID